MSFDFKKIEMELIKFQKPARYIGNESGIPEKDFINSPVKFAIAFPDVYEIGMSNSGIQIIYDRINNLDFACCERVFSPWIDFDKYLTDNKIPLFSLESKSPLFNFDFIGFSIQYELLFSNFLNILKLSNINAFNEQRKENDPIIICGGPGIINPHPYSPFSDLFFIGEAEGKIEEFLTIYNGLKGKNSRQQIIEKLSKIDGIYSPVFSKNKVQRQVYKNFGIKKSLPNYIIPNIDIIHNKLVIEIMRGCPNKCRFCQAGLIYKPCREKNIKNILEEIEFGITKTGVSEVTLSSLSSGDYSGIAELSGKFNKKFSHRNISFSFPSIKVESFDISLLEKISNVRKSGLTFAIETGSLKGQKILNKIIQQNKINEIIKYASQNGWKLIKLYFMIGLPYIDSEIKDLISYIDNVIHIDKKIKINLNLAVFVPKPHTVFQYASQMPIEKSIETLNHIYKYYSKTRVKVKTHDPYSTYIEGFIARGDRNVGLAVYEAFINGAKFDCWKEYFNYDIYKQAFDKFNITYEKYLAKKDLRRNNVWENIDIGVTKKYYKDELKKSLKYELTKDCTQKCDKECKICNKKEKINKPVKAKKTIQRINKNNDAINKKSNEKLYRYFLEFSKKGLNRYLGHIDLIKYFERLFIRSDIPLVFTQGFNPHPKMQFSSALSLGIESNCEILEFFLYEFYEAKDIYEIFNKILNKDLPVNKVRFINENIEKSSLIEKILYYEYSFKFNENEYDKIKIIYEKYKIDDVLYEIEVKNKKISGKYQDYVEFKELNKQFLSLSIKNIHKVPKIHQIINDIFKDYYILPVKEKMFALKDNQIIELFDL